MKKLRIYIDMDGVIADFDKAKKLLPEPCKARPDLHVNYLHLDVISGAYYAVKYLYENHDVFIASTPPWTRPEVWSDKRVWLEQNFPYLKRKLILTHRKDFINRRCLN